MTIGGTRMGALDEDIKTFRAWLGPGAEKIPKSAFLPIAQSLQRFRAEQLGTPTRLEGSDQRGCIACSWGGYVNVYDFGHYRLGRELINDSETANECPLSRGKPPSVTDRRTSRMCQRQTWLYD